MEATHVYYPFMLVSEVKLDAPFTLSIFLTVYNVIVIRYWSLEIHSVS